MGLAIAAASEVRHGGEDRVPGGAQDRTAD